MTGLFGVGALETTWIAGLLLFVLQFRNELAGQSHSICSLHLLSLSGTWAQDVCQRILGARTTGYCRIQYYIWGIRPEPIDVTMKSGWIYGPASALTSDRISELSAPLSQPPGTRWVNILVPSIWMHLAFLQQKFLKLLVPHNKLPGWHRCTHSRNSPSTG